MQATFFQEDSELETSLKTKIRAHPNQKCERKAPFCPKCKISICFQSQIGSHDRQLAKSRRRCASLTNTTPLCLGGPLYQRRRQHWCPGQEHRAVFLSPGREGERAPDLLSQEPGFSIKRRNRQHAQNPRQRECWQELPTD